jgi:hypothetical protein
MAVLQLRDPKWKAFRRRWIYGDANHQAHRECEACGSRLLPEAHHVEAFEHNPKRELDDTNLITLCHWKACHLHLGHGGDFHFYVPRVRELARQVRVGRKTLDEAAAVARLERVPIHTGA